MSNDTMADQSFDPVLLADSLSSLTYQLSLCEKDNNVKLAQALADTQRELRDLRKEVAETNRMVKSLRYLRVLHTPGFY